MRRGAPVPGLILMRPSSSFSELSGEPFSQEHREARKPTIASKTIRFTNFLRAGIRVGFILRRCFSLVSVLAESIGTTLCCSVSARTTMVSRGFVFLSFLTRGSLFFICVSVYFSHAWVEKLAFIGKHSYFAASGAGMTLPEYGPMLMKLDTTRGHLLLRPEESQVHVE